MSKNIIIAGIVAGVALIGLIGGNMVASSKAEDAVNNLITEVEASGATVQYDSVSANVFGTVEIDDITLSNANKTIFIENLTANGLGYAAENPEDIEDLEMTLTGIDFSGLQGIRIDETPDDLPEILIYAAIKDTKIFDAKLVLDTDRDKGILDIQELTLSGEDLGNVTLSAMATGKSLLEKNPDLTRPIALTRFSLALKDDGLMDRFIRADLDDNEDFDEAKDRIITSSEEQLDDLSGLEKDTIEGLLALIDGDTVTIYRGNEEPLELSPLVFMNSRMMDRLYRQADLKVDID